MAHSSRVERDTVSVRVAGSIPAEPAKKLYMQTLEEIKKAISVIPDGGYCYGYPKGIIKTYSHSKRLPHGGCCPYWRKGGYCTFLKQVDDTLLKDQIKICTSITGKFDFLFPPIPVPALN
jgi:hypothetical protein